MVLDAYDAAPVGFRQLVGETRRRELRVEIAGNDLRSRCPSDPVEMFDRLPEELDRLDVIDRADVLGERHGAVGVDGERQIRLRAEGEDRLIAKRGHDRLWDPTPRPTKEDEPSGDLSPDRVITAGGDPPIVQQEMISDSVQAPFDLLVVDQHRTSRQIRARHHKRHTDPGEEQVMEPGVREHHTDGMQPRSDPLGQVSGALAQHDDRPFDSPKLCPVRVIQVGERWDQPLRGHQRVRLRRPPDQSAEPGHRVLACRVARQVRPADPLHRNDLPASQRLDRPIENRFGIAIERQCRAACCTGRRLCMVASIEWIAVFGTAHCAHREVAHRRPRPVVRQRFDHRESRAAVCAAGRPVSGES